MCGIGAFLATYGSVYMAYPSKEIEVINVLRDSTSCPNASLTKLITMLAGLIPEAMAPAALRICRQGQRRRLCPPHLNLQGMKAFSYVVLFSAAYPGPSFLASSWPLLL